LRSSVTFSSLTLKVVPVNLPYLKENNSTRDKAIIFDLGGVFLALDYQRTKQAFVALGSTNFIDYFAQANQKGLNRE